MVRQSGRDGMGSHKHFISGNNGPSPKYKMGRMLDANKELAEQAKRRPKSKMVSSVRGAFRRGKK